jgi:hypothetical protein
MMNGSDLSSAIYSALLSAMESEMGVPPNPAQLEKFCTAVSNAMGATIVNYIKANATVTVNAALTIEEMTMLVAAGGTITSTGTTPNTIE